MERKPTNRQKFLRRPRALTLTISVPSLLLSPKAKNKTEKQNQRQVENLQRSQSLHRSQSSREVWRNKDVAAYHNHNQSEELGAVSLSAVDIHGLVHQSSNGKPPTANGLNNRKSFILNNNRTVRSTTVGSIAAAVDNEDSHNGHVCAYCGLNVSYRLAGGQLSDLDLSYKTHGQQHSDLDLSYAGGGQNWRSGGGRRQLMRGECGCKNRSVIGGLESTKEMPSPRLKRVGTMSHIFHQLNKSFRMRRTQSQRDLPTKNKRFRLSARMSTSDLRAGSVGAGDILLAGYIPAGPTQQPGPSIGTVERARAHSKSRSRGLANIDPKFTQQSGLQNSSEIETSRGIMRIQHFTAQDHKTTSTRFPRLEDCAHFHYEFADIGSLQLELSDEESKNISSEDQYFVIKVRSPLEARSGVRTWMLRRTFSDLRSVDRQIHTCVYDRKFSQLPEIPQWETFCSSGQNSKESVREFVSSYLARLGTLTGPLVTCGPVLSWLEVDNRGNRLIITDESDINTPAVAAAYAVRRYTRQAQDEISFEVGDMISVIDMPEPDESIWWRGKRGFDVGLFPCDCVQVIGDKVPASASHSLTPGQLATSSSGATTATTTTTSSSSAMSSSLVVMSSTSSATATGDHHHHYHHHNQRRTTLANDNESSASDGGDNNRNNVIGGEESTLTTGSSSSFLRGHHHSLSQTLPPGHHHFADFLSTTPPTCGGPCGLSVSAGGRLTSRRRHGSTQSADAESPSSSEPTKPVLRKHGKLITFFRSFILSRPTRGKLKKRGILKERVFGCDLGEHLLNTGQDSVPKVLIHCSDFIENKGIVDGIYRLSGISSNIQRLRVAFDEDRVPNLYEDKLVLQDIHSVSSLLKMYFRELPNPVCTFHLYDRFVDAAKSTEDQRLAKLRDVVIQLPPPNYRTLEYLARHLFRVSQHYNKTGMTAKNVAIVWAPNLLRSKSLEVGGVAALQGVGVQAVVTEYLIKYCELIFTEKGCQELLDNAEAVSRMAALVQPSIQSREAVGGQEATFSSMLDDSNIANFFSPIPGPPCGLNEGADKLLGDDRQLSSCEGGSSSPSSSLPSSAAGSLTVTPRVAAKSRPKSLAISTPAKLMTLEGGGRGPVKLSNIMDNQKYIEVGGGPDNLPAKYHTVIDLPHGVKKAANNNNPAGANLVGGSFKQKKSTAWKSLFSGGKDKKKVGANKQEVQINILNANKAGAAKLKDVMNKPTLRPVRSAEFLIPKEDSMQMTPSGNESLLDTRYQSCRIDRYSSSVARPTTMPATSSSNQQPTAASQSMTRSASNHTNASSDRDELGPLEPVTSACHTSSVAVDSPKCHSRSSSHDSYFEQQRRSVLAASADQEEEDEEDDMPETESSIIVGNKASEEPIVGAQGERLNNAVAMAKEASSTSRVDSSLDISEIQMNFDLEDNEMKIFSEDEAMVSTSMGSELSLPRSPLTEEVHHHQQIGHHTDVKSTNSHPASTTTSVGRSTAVYIGNNSHIAMVGPKTSSPAVGGSGHFVRSYRGGGGAVGVDPVASSADSGAGMGSESPGSSTTSPKLRRMSLKDKLKKFTSPTLTRKGPSPGQSIPQQPQSGPVDHHQQPPSRMVDSGVGIDLMEGPNSLPSSSLSDSYHANITEDLISQSSSGLAVKQTTTGKAEPSEDDSVAGQSHAASLSVSRMSSQVEASSGLDVSESLENTGQIYNSPSIRFIDQSSSYEIGPDSELISSNTTPRSTEDEDSVPWNEGGQTVRENIQEVAGHVDAGHANLHDGGVDHVVKAEVHMANVEENSTDVEPVPPPIVGTDAAGQPANTVGEVAALADQPEAEADEAPVLASVGSALQGQSSGEWTSRTRSMDSDEILLNSVPESSRHASCSTTRSEFSYSLANATVSENESFAGVFSETDDVCDDEKEENSANDEKITSLLDTAVESFSQGMALTAGSDSVPRLEAGVDESGSIYLPTNEPERDQPGEPSADATKADVKELVMLGEVSLEADNKDVVVAAEHVDTTVISGQIDETVISGHVDLTKGHYTAITGIVSDDIEDLPAESQFKLEDVEMIEQQLPTDINNEKQLTMSRSLERSEAVQPQPPPLVSRASSSPPPLPPKAPIPAPRSLKGLDWQPVPASRNQQPPRDGPSSPSARPASPDARSEGASSPTTASPTGLLTSPQFESVTLRRSPVTSPSRNRSVRSDFISNLVDQGANFNFNNRGGKAASGTSVNTGNSEPKEAAKPSQPDTAVKSKRSPASEKLSAERKPKLSEPEGGPKPARPSTLDKSMENEKPTEVVAAPPAQETASEDCKTTSASLPPLPKLTQPKFTGIAKALSPQPYFKPLSPTSTEVKVEKQDVIKDESGLKDIDSHHSTSTVTTLSHSDSGKASVTSQAFPASAISSGASCMTSSAPPFITSASLIIQSPACSQDRPELDMTVTVTRRDSSAKSKEADDISRPPCSPSSTKPEAKVEHTRSEESKRPVVERELTSNEKYVMSLPSDGRRSTQGIPEVEKKLQKKSSSRFKSKTLRGKSSDSTPLDKSGRCKTSSLSLYAGDNLAQGDRLEEEDDGDGPDQPLQRRNSIHNVPYVDVNDPETRNRMERYKEERRSLLRAKYKAEDYFSTEYSRKKKLSTSSESTESPYQSSTLEPGQSGKPASAKIVEEPVAGKDGDKNNKIDLKIKEEVRSMVINSNREASRMLREGSTGGIKPPGQVAAKEAVNGLTEPPKIATTTTMSTSMISASPATGLLVVNTSIAGGVAPTPKLSPRQRPEEVRKLVNLKQPTHSFMSGAAISSSVANGKFTLAAGGNGSSGGAALIATATPVTATRNQNSMNQTLFGNNQKFAFNKSSSTASGNKKTVATPGNTAQPIQVIDTSVKSGHGSLKSAGTGGSNINFGHIDDSVNVKERASRFGASQAPLHVNHLPTVTPHVAAAAAAAAAAETPKLRTLSVPAGSSSDPSAGAVDQHKTRKFSAGSNAVSLPATSPSKIKNMAAIFEQKQQ